MRKMDAPGQIKRSALRRAIQAGFSNGILAILNHPRTIQDPEKTFSSSWKWMLTLASLRKAGISENSNHMEIRQAALNFGIHQNSNNPAMHHLLFCEAEMNRIEGKAILAGLNCISSHSILSLIPKRHRIGLEDPWGCILPEDICSCFEVVTEAKPLIEGGQVVLAHKEERRNSGVHHTPFDVTQRMIDTSLEKKNMGDSSIPDPFVICDLAVGAGAFLVQATRILLNMSMGRSTVEEVISRHIIGFDIDADAIKVANLCLHMEAGFPERANSYNLHCLDSVGEENSREIIHGKIKEMSLDSRGVADITIGNPPYVQIDIESRARMAELGYVTSTTNNISAIFLEQALEVTEVGGVVCQIVPISIIQSQKMRAARSMLLSRCTSIEIEAFDCVPGYIFDQGKIGSNSNSSITRQVAIVSAIRGDSETVVSISRMIRWSSSERDGLFDSVNTVRLPNEYKIRGVFPMLGDEQAVQNFQHLSKLEYNIADLFGDSRNQLFIPKAVRYFITGVISTLGRDNEIKLIFNDTFSRNLAQVIVNSSFFYWYWKVVGNGFQVNLSEVSSLEIPDPRVFSKELKNQINRMAERLSRNRSRLSVKKSNKGMIRNVKYDLDRRLMSDLDELVNRIYNFPVSNYPFHASKSNNLRDYSALLNQICE